MPLYHYKCQVCPKTLRRICTPEEADPHLSPKLCCGKPMLRDPRPPSSRCVEVLDNNLMTHRVERLVDAERLFKERAEATKKQRGE